MEFKKNIKMEGIFKGLSHQNVPLEILNICNKALHPYAFDNQIYPELFRYLFDYKGQGYFVIKPDYEIK